MRIKSNTKKGYEDISEEKFVLDTSYPTSTTRRGRVQQEGKQAPALTCSSENNLRIVEQKTKNKMESYRIRKLTERECFRLMGVRDEDIDKLMQSGISRSQLYKMAGNSIVCDVLMGIFNKMFVDNKPEYGQQLTLF